MIKNYTSTVTAGKSVLKIEKCLVDHGAEQILKIYDKQSKILTGISFIINRNGSNIPFQLPARIDRIEKRLKDEVKRPVKGTYERISEQAERTAWKLLSEWVEIQMSMIELDQAEFVEIFMPYIFDNKSKQTLFEKAKDSNFKMLEYKE